MAIRGKKNPFPPKTKPTTTVFTTPQKMDKGHKAPITRAAVNNGMPDKTTAHSGASASAIKSAAMAHNRKRG